MKRLTILIPEGPLNLASIIGTYMVFNRADVFWQQAGHDPLFKVEMAGSSREIDLYSGMFAVRPGVDLNTIKKTDLVIIPALQPGVNYTDSIGLNKGIIGWIADQYKNGAEIASICTGAFLLASTGLMKGRNCSTHWFAANTFRQMFPEVNLVTDMLITDEKGIYTNGGAFSFLNLLIYLVEKYYDRQTAISCSKIFEIDIERSSQSPFTVFLGQKNHDDEPIRKAQKFIENNFYDKISVEDLASRFSIGRRSFDRRFKKATGNSPVEYLQRVKIEAAKKSFETTRKSVKEVMFDVGYSDFKAFRNVFKKITGLSPFEYRNRYNKEFLVAV